MIDFDKLPERRVKVTRAVRKKDPGNYGGRKFREGEILYRYTGPTYGCIDSAKGSPLSEKGSRETPFFEFPNDAFEEI